MSAIDKRCSSCGRQAIGTAADGKPYCERRGCIDWKLERYFRGVK